MRPIPVRENTLLHRVIRRSQATDPIAIVMLGHLDIERHVEMCINAYLVHSINFNKQQVLDRYNIKVNMLRWLGLSSQPLHMLLVEFGRVRNVVAHPNGKHGDVTPSDVETLLEIADQVTLDPPGLNLGLYARHMPFPQNIERLYSIMPTVFALIHPRSRLEPVLYAPSEVSLKLASFQRGLNMGSDDDERDASR